MARTRISLALWMALTLLAPAGIAHAGGADDAPEAEGAVVAVDEGDAGTTVELLPGDRLQVTLPCQAGTGFSWGPGAPLPAFLRLESDELLDAAEAPGAPEAQRLVYLALAAGDPAEGQLVLHYRRPWETRTSPARSFELTVIRVE